MERVTPTAFGGVIVARNRLPGKESSRSKWPHGGSRAKRAVGGSQRTLCSEADDPGVSHASAIIRADERLRRRIDGPLIPALGNTRSDPAAERGHQRADLGMRDTGLKSVPVADSGGLRPSRSASELSEVQPGRNCPAPWTRHDALHITSFVWSL
jgi:hypothetical protein